MTVGRFLVHPLPIGALVSLAFLIVPGQADVLAQFVDSRGNACPSDPNVESCYDFPESLANSGQFNSYVYLKIVNTGPYTIKTGYVHVSLPVFIQEPPVPAGFIEGDQLDAIDLLTLGSHPPCDNKEIESGIDNACVARVYFKILDHDPFDTRQPIDDVGKWEIDANVEWNIDSQNISGNAAGKLYVSVDDAPVPEPTLLIPTILLSAALVARKRIARAN